MKTTYAEIVYLSKYLTHKNTINDNEFSFFNIKFQVEENTPLHLFALDEKSLRLILEYYKENWREYLWSIIMK